MLLAQEVAHIVTGMMTLVGAATLMAFVLLRPNFSPQLRMPMVLLAVGLLSISLFHFAFVLRINGSVLQGVSFAAVIGAAISAIATLVLANIAFQSRLLSALHHRVEAHRRTLNRLRKSRLELDQRVKERTREVHEQEKRLRIALRDSNISVFMQDTNLRYVWMRNAPEGFNASEVIGKCDEEILPPSAAKVAAAAKRHVIETGEDLTTEICVEPRTANETARYFDVTTEPYYDERGELQGLLSVSVETTEKRRREELLKATLMEVSHRTKNQLAVLMSIARQLGATKPETKNFLPAFEARLRALSICQDVLVEYDWAAPPLDHLVRAQLEPYLTRNRVSSSTLKISGPDVRITPTAVQNLGLVLNEFALNAFENGAMNDPAGRLEITWELREAVEHGPDGKTLAIEWIESSGNISPASELKSRFGQAMAHKLARSALSGRLTFEPTADQLIIRLLVGSSALAE